MKRKCLNYSLLLLLILFSIQTRINAQVGELLWEDNFNSINTDVWSFDIGNGSWGWGNGELEYYREENASIEAVPGETGNNALVITAKRENYGEQAFTSARLKSENGIAVQYGMIEFRAQMPNLETGLWPALWMLGTSTATWPAKGEIDIMEMGHSQAERDRQGHGDAAINNYVGSNLIFYAEGACSDANPTCAASTAYDVDYDTPYISSSTLVNRFLTYRLYWSSTEMRFTVIDNGTEIDLYSDVFVIGEETTEFQAPFYFLMNLAVGGVFTDATTNEQVTVPFDAKMYVDYVRVYKWNGEGEILEGNTAIQESGTFGLFTDNTPTTNKLEAGVSSDIYAWNNFDEGTIAPYEGTEVIAWQTTDATQWFGGGIASRQARDMSNFVDGNLKFRIKIPADVSFRIGITDTYTNQYFINFAANESKYGLVRDGEWGQVTIPVSDLLGDIIALQSMQYLFAITNGDGALPGYTFEMALDDIYWEGGGDAPNVAVTGVSLSSTSITLEAGDTQQLTASIAPSNATNKNVSWTSSNTSVATVSNGLISAISAGSAIITVTSEDGSYTATSTIAVTSANVSVTGVSVSPTSTTLEIGASQQLTATIAPSNATNKNVSWTSSNTSVATVSGGLVTAIAEGTATISVTSTDGGYTATSSVTVNGVDEQTPYGGTPWAIPGTIEAEDYDNGGQDIAYNDNDAANSGGQYRTDQGVDIEACNLGGYNVGWIGAGEWLEYTVNVATAGTYDITLSVASVSGSSVSIDFGGADVTGTIAVPATGAWQTWDEVSVSSVYLSAGQQIMRVYMDGGDFNLNSINFASSNTNIAVTGVSVSLTSVTLDEGETQQITASVSPTDATNQNVSWSSSNTSIVTVSNGLITAIAEGTAIITVTTEDGSYTATTSITVNGISLPGEDITDLGGTITAQYDDSPSAERFPNLIDNDVTTKYLTFNASAWVQYEAPSTYIVTGYTVTSANDVPDRDPLTWTLQGSNDGSSWTTIDSRSGIDFPSRYQTLSFEFSNSTAYSYYRFNMTNNTGTLLQIAEIELFGTEEVINNFSVLIEAESYVTMSGVDLEACSEGTQNVGWIDAGDYMVWDVNIPTTGTYTVEYRVASANGGGTIQLEKAGGSPVYGSIAVDATGGWQVWTTISHTVTLDAGQQQIAIVAPTGGYNINWLQISQGLKSAGQEIENSIEPASFSVHPNPAESTLYLSGVQEGSTIVVHDINGRVLIQESQFNGALNIQELDAGMYFIRIQNSNSKVLRFIKK